jgi:nitroreductase
VRRLFNLPEHIVPVGAVAAGYPAENPPPRTRFTPARVHHEHW